MLDKETAAVLKVINEISDGAFKMIDADELINKTNTDERLTKPALAAIIKKLAEHDLVKIKTSTADMYVIAPTPKAKLAEERIVEDTITTPTATGQALSSPALKQRSEVA
jgi:phenylalanyl-tRNA synthetase beta subunit